MYFVVFVLSADLDGLAGILSHSDVLRATNNATTGNVWFYNGRKKNSIEIGVVILPSSEMQLVFPAPIQTFAKSPLSALPFLSAGL